MICTRYLAKIPLVIFQNCLKFHSPNGSWNYITISKYHSWYLCQISLQIMLLSIQNQKDSYLNDFKTKRKNCKSSSITVMVLEKDSYHTSASLNPPSPSPDLSKELKRDKNCNNYSGSPWRQLLKASKWGQKLFLYSAIKPCNFHFRWNPLAKLSSTQNQIKQTSFE